MGGVDISWWWLWIVPPKFAKVELRSRPDA
ncbi:MAG: hypothetical protein BWY69_01794 [Planctomycetes bacterium ADurb.Bin401]|nr:MAG: hypothetical protein BWY69_01794 [Planctomycetes bacterium ADurb.Bin401]